MIQLLNCLFSGHLIQKADQRRAVVGFKKVVRPLNIVGVQRVLPARGGGGCGGREWVKPPSRKGGLGDLPQENFVIQDD